MKKNKQSKTKAMFWYAGLCVGSTVLAGKTVADTVGSGVSTVGGACRRALRLKTTTVEKAVEKDRTAKPTRAWLTAGAGRILKVTLYPITLAGTLTARLKRTPTAPSREQRGEAILTPARPVVAVAASSKREAPLPSSRRETAVLTPARPAVERATRVAAPSKPEAPRPSHRREEAIFPLHSRGRLCYIDGVDPEEADAADFATSVQKIVFRRMLYDLSRPDSATRVHAASVAGGIRHPLAMRALAGQLSRDESAEVRRSCVAALAALGMEEGLPAAEHALQDPDISVRVAAVIAVYRLGGPRSVAALARMLRDPNAEVRRMAVSCIGWLRQKDVSDQVAPLLNDASVHVRLSAIEAISDLRGHEAIPALVERLGDPVESVRRKAFTVLQEIAGKKMGEYYPENDAEREIVMARWRHWWREEAGRRSSIGNEMEQQ